MIQARFSATAVLSSLLAFGAFAILFAPIAEAGKKLPGFSLADAKLQRDVTGNIQAMETILGGGCRKSMVVDTEIVESPARLNVDRWVEHWTVDRCGTQVRYRVELTPSPKGGTDFGVSILEDEGRGEQPVPAETEALPKEVPQGAPPPETPPR